MNGGLVKKGREMGCCSSIREFLYNKQLRYANGRV